MTIIQISKTQLFLNDFKKFIILSNYINVFVLHSYAGHPTLLIRRYDPCEKQVHVLHSYKIYNNQVI